MALGQYNGGKALFHLDGNTNDSSGNGYNGTPLNVVWVPGIIGSGAASFNGTSSYINGTIPVASGAFTTSVLVNHISNASSRVVICSGGAASSPQWVITINNNKPIAKVTNTSNIGNDATAAVTITGKHNLILTWDGTTNANGVKLYLDGNILGTATFSGTEKASTGLYIGCGYQGSRVDYYNSIIDEVVIKDIAWSAQEVKKYYTMSKGRFGII